jgi:hypothetical protein
MDVSMNRRSLGRSLGVAGLALAAALAATPRVAAERSAEAQTQVDVAVKAAILYNFAKFTEWPTLPAGAIIVYCVVGDNVIAAALAETVQGQNISGHSLDVSRPQDAASWRACHLLFLGDAEASRASAVLSGTRALPILTVSDGPGFAQAGGIIELYIDAGKTRFAINIDAVGRSGLRLSSRLLNLARIVRDKASLLP